MLSVIGLQAMQHCNYLARTVKGSTAALYALDKLLMPLRKRFRWLQHLLLQTRFLNSQTVGAEWTTS